MVFESVGGREGGDERFLVDLIKRVEEVLRNYPLCNTCLGRLFSKYGMGISNFERGLSLKTILAMKLHVEYLKGVLPVDDFRKLAVNAGEGVLSTYLRLHQVEKLTPANCYVCGGRLTSELISNVAREVCKELSAYSPRTFLIGIVIDNTLQEKELEILMKHGLLTAESMKRELKREVGKLVKTLCFLEPDFEKPDALAVVHLNSDFTYKITVQPAPVYIKGVYWKLGRRISHVPWFTTSGGRRYSLSIQDAAEALLTPLFKASKVIIHAAGREDVDARMLGTGRHLVVELKEPKVRSIEITHLNEASSDRLAGYPIKMEFLGYASKKDVRLVKELSKKKRKLYRLLVYSPTEPLTDDELKYLEDFFRNRVIKQLTPTRILRRKKEREKTRRVYEVKTLKVSSNIFEVLVFCDGGLYVKELVHCDQGRTSPCFSDVLGKRVIPLELDVLYVEG